MSDVAARAAYFVGDVAYGIPLMALDIYFDMIPIIRPLEEEADEDQQVGIEDMPELEPIYAGNEAMEPFYLYNLDGCRLMPTTKPKYVIKLGNV